MDLNYFKQVRILDGGTGQELLVRGLATNGTLWSANALLQDKYHGLLLNTHLDFVEAGAEVIVTATFATRKKRLKDNNIEDKFEHLNQKACEIAIKVKEKFPNTLIAGSLPPQNLTYIADERNKEEITKNFKEQATILNPYIDFFYFDVLSSIKEFRCGINAIKEFKKPYLIGIHISEGTNLPSGEKISEIKDLIDHKVLGVILSCISPENYEINLKELKDLGVPFGFKLNGFVTTKPNTSYTENYLKSKTGNPTDVMGKRNDLSPKNLAVIVKKFKDEGATILGGCCETGPSHISEIAKLI